jgi:hypothetical protein
MIQAALPWLVAELSLLLFLLSFMSLLLGMLSSVSNSRCRADVKGSTVWQIAPP